MAAGEEVDSVELRADLFALAADTSRHLEETLSVLVVSREDVENTFRRLREEHPDWPKRISQKRWARLEQTRYLSDMTDVVCDGGDYWTAIEVAIQDEFEA